jgi:hypothetical protein
MDYLEKQERLNQTTTAKQYDQLLSSKEYEDLRRDLTDREEQVLEIYKDHHWKNQHKMVPIPVYKLGYFRKNGGTEVK